MVYENIVWCPGVKKFYTIVKFFSIRIEYPLNYVYLC